MQTPLSVEEGEGQGAESSSLLQGDQIQDHQQPGLGPPSGSSPNQGFLGLFAGQADEGTGGPGVLVQEAGESGGGFGLAVLGSGFAVTGEKEEQQGLEGRPEVGGWHEGQEGAE